MKRDIHETNKDVNEPTIQIKKLEEIINEQALIIERLEN